MIKYFTLAFLAVGLTACSNEAPSCSDSQTTDLVMEIAFDHIESTYGVEFKNGVKLSVESIRTTDINEKLGSFSCAADLMFETPDISDSVPIEYTSENADGGESYYVNVYGLEAL